MEHSYGSEEYDDEGSYSGDPRDSSAAMTAGGMGSHAGHMSSKDKSKTKRRSKNDNSGRDFVCGCKKRYLSYPALYTHIKQKHNGITPPGTNTS